MNIHAESTLVRIRDYYLGKGNVVLTEDEEKILTRMEDAYNFLRSSKSPAETAVMLQRRYPDHSKSTLYRDINAAMALFGDAVAYSKDAMKKLATDHAMSLIDRARTAGDRNAEAKALAMLVKINGLDREELNMEDPMKIMSQPPVIEIPESIQSFLLNISNMGAVNLMDLRNKKQLPVASEQNTIQPAPVALSDRATEGEVY